MDIWIVLNLVFFGRIGARSREHIRLGRRGHRTVLFALGETFGGLRRNPAKRLLSFWAEKASLSVGSRFCIEW